MCDLRRRQVRSSVREKRVFASPTASWLLRTKIKLSSYSHNFVRLTLFLELYVLSGTLITLGFFEVAIAPSKTTELFKTQKMVFGLPPMHHTKTIARLPSLRCQKMIMVGREVTVLEVS